MLAGRCSGVTATPKRWSFANERTAPHCERRDLTVRASARGHPPRPQAVAMARRGIVLQLLTPPSQEQRSCPNAR
ncbi:hypothetical protein WOLCODRAFT_146003 [Wolfiporia cocos MD-104 SS10]|uniref:Uncharacterized protein n=1 Tax=Wolfiporia cocos (strain MD-104) TaxID=742152 RepID=A0A2H3J162_WOLCO|nr:hypothetical protein WOLCODRAFT_146003 [Wolfiporia cocos MD-104 SS10]